MKKSPEFKNKFSDSLTEYKYKQLLDGSSKPNQKNIKKSQPDILTTFKQKIRKFETSEYKQTFSKITNDSLMKKDILMTSKFIDNTLVSKINLDTKIKTCKNLLSNKNKKKSDNKKINNKSGKNIKIIKLKNGEKSQTIFRNINYNINKNTLRCVNSSVHIEKIKDFNNYLKDKKTTTISKKCYTKKIYKKKKSGFFRSRSVIREKENLIKVINISFNSALSTENKELLINNGLIVLEKFMINKRIKSLIESLYKLKINMQVKKENKEQKDENKKFYVKKEQFNLLRVLKNRKIRDMNDLKKYIIIMYEQNYKYEV